MIQEVAELEGSPVLQIADALDNAHRQGAERDYPEGSCYITISDTLARQWAQALRGASVNTET